MRERKVIRAQAALYDRTHGRESADKYRAIAEWWRLHAKISQNPKQCLVTMDAMLKKAGVKYHVRRC
jgi:hypothetical protein